MKTIQSYSVCFALLLAVGMSAPLNAEEKPLMATVEIRGLNALANEASLVADAIQMPFERESVVQGFLGTMQLTPAALDLDGVIRMHVMFPDQHIPGAPPGVVVGLPVHGDGQILIEEMKKAWTLKEQHDDIYTFTAQPGMPVKDVFVRLVGRHAWAALEPDHLITFLGTHQNVAVDAKGTFALAIHVHELVPALRALMKEQMTALQTINGDMEMDLAVQSMQSQMNMMLSIMEQLHSIRIGLGVTPEFFDMQFGLKTMPDTMLGRMVQSMTRPAEAYMQIHPQDAVLASAGFLPFPDELIDAYAQWIRDLALMGEDVMDEHQMKLAMAGMNLMRGQHGGSYAMWVTTGDTNMPVRFGQVWQLKDPGAFIPQLTTYLDLMESFAKEELDMTDETIETRSYRDTTVYRYSFMAAMGDAEAAKAITMFMPFAGKLAMEYAIVGDMLLSTGGDSQAMDAAIDAALDGGGLSLDQAPELRRHFPDVPADAVDYSVLRPLALIKIAELLGMEEKPALQQLKSIDMAMTGYSVTEGTDYVSQSRMDMNGLQEIVQAVVLLWQELMTFGMQEFEHEVDQE